MKVTRGGRTVTGLRAHAPRETERVLCHPCVVELLDCLDNAVQKFQVLLIRGDFDTRDANITRKLLARISGKREL